MNALSDDERSYIESYGVPVEEGTRSFFIASLHAESLLPTPDELKQLRSYIEYKITSFYTEAFIAKLLAMPLPGDIGHNTTCFRKGHCVYGGEDWFYARSTWTQVGWPNPATDDYHPLDLLEVVAHAERGFGEVDPRWTAWIESHTAFAPPVAFQLGPRSRPSALALA